MNNIEKVPSSGGPVHLHTAGVVGLGLIGGSIAKALKKRAGLTRVVGLDRKPEVLAAAIADGAIDQGALLLPLEPGAASDPFSALTGCDVVFLCTPVDTLPALAQRAAAHCDGILTDAGSVKLPVLQALGHLPRFIGGHPMAGSERTGYLCSSADLLEGAVYVISAPERDTPASCAQTERDAESLAELVRDMGALPMRMEAGVHDHAVAAISHLPHAVAAALSVLAAEQDDRVLSRLAAGGFKDITRIASASPSLWTGICLQSAPALLPVLDAFSDVLDRFRAAIGDGDAETLRSLFEAGAAYRSGLPASGHGALESYVTLKIQIPDQPGALAGVASLLGERGISIRNMDITNVRSYESGVLRILLHDSHQLEAAVSALTEGGYVCER